jgi:hypothetical protein
MSSDPEQMQRIEVVRIGVEQLSINRYRLSNAPGSVMLEGGRQSV